MPEMSGRREKFDFSSYTPIAIGDKWPLIQHLMVAKYRTNSQNITFKTLNVKQSPSTDIPLTATLLKTCLKVVRNSFPFSITTELYERFTRL